MIILIANIVDFIAAGIMVGSGAIRQKKKILVVQNVQLFLQAISMLMLGGITGAISNVLSCFRNYLGYREKLNWAWKAVLIGASVAMTILLNEQGLLGMIPAAVSTVFILFMDVKDPVKFKLLVTLTVIPWVFYHCALQAYVGMACDIATVITNGITLRIMIKERDKG